MTDADDLASLTDDELLNDVPQTAPRAGVSLAQPALIVGTFALVLSWITPFAAAIGLVSVLLAVIALARHHTNATLARWGLGLGLAALVCGGVWVLWILEQLG
ncbi:MAG: hypothetical protein QM607_11125 [Microbacterium sp.]